MKYGSVCSGIEAASVAWHPLGWQPQWLSEIEKFPKAVLAHHYPQIPDLGDMTKLYENKIFQESEINLLVGGTPCQSFSVAGLRKGLADPRGNLCLEFLRLVDIKRPRWFVWENVPGVLSSSKGRDFGSFLGAIQELGYGFAYRILDARYFGVPQRRRRVFVVGYLGDWRPAAAVLFERESLSGNPEKGRKKRRISSPPIRQSTERRGGIKTVDFRNLQLGDEELSGTIQAKKTGGYSLNYTTGVIQTFDRQSTGKYGTDTVASTVSARDYKSASDLVCVTGTKTHALKADGFDGSEDGTGRGQPIIAFQTKGSNIDIGEISGTIGSNADRASGSCHRSGRLGADCTKSLVRRLTPKECERLQGFPDDYTLIPIGKKAADGPRYKALGNSMAVPVMAWIGRRIQEVEMIIKG